MKCLHSGFCKTISAILLIFMISGCGRNGWQAATNPTSGHITINGEAPEGAVVELRCLGEPPDERNSRPWGVVDQDGNYSLTTYNRDDGAPAGSYAVTFRWPPTISKPSLADRLNGAFSDPESSQWKVEIVDGKNELPDIELTDVDVDSLEQADKKMDGPPMGPATGSQ